jgi:hypothetical protein
VLRQRVKALRQRYEIGAASCEYGRVTFQPQITLEGAAAPDRQRALPIVRQRLTAAAPLAEAVEAVIPVDRSGWESVLEDAGITAHVRQLLERLADVEMLDLNDSRVIGGVLRRSLARAAETAEQLAVCVEQASWFVPPVGRESDRDALLRVPALAIEAITSCIEALTSSDPEAPLDRWGSSAAELDGLIDQLADRPTIASEDTSALELIFGATPARFRDRRGVIDSARIRAFYATRPHELEQISRRLFKSLIGDAAVMPPDAATFAATFGLSERPLICHQVARETLAEVKRRFSDDPDTAAATLARRFAGIKNSASTHFDGIVPTAARLEDAQGDGERARLVLELYRLTSEGPMRHTGWAYLELRGHPQRKAPTLSEVRDLLLADGSPLARLIADAIHPEWRNPASHEEHHWDAALERIVVGEATATLKEVEAATGYAISVMHGVETGLAGARLLIEELAQKLESEDAVHEAPLVDLRVRNAIGRQGVYVWDTNWRGDSVEVVLEVDLDHELHRVLASVLGASLEAPAATHWTVSERDGRRSIAISSDATTAARGLLEPGVDQGPIDVNVLLPLVAGLMIAAGEAVRDVAVDVTRLALKHPLGLAQDEVSPIMRGEPGALARLASALDIGGRALAASWQLIGADGDLRAVPAQLRQAHVAALAWGLGEPAQFASLSEHINTLFDHYHSLPERELLRAPGVGGPCAGGLG